MANTITGPQASQWYGRQNEKAYEDQCQDFVGVYDSESASRDQTTDEWLVLAMWAGHQSTHFHNTEVLRGWKSRARDSDPTREGP